MFIAAPGGVVGVVRSSGQAEAPVGEEGPGAAVGVVEEVEAFQAVAADSAAVEPGANGNMETKQFLNALNDGAIAQAIGDAEKRTSGEIRVFVSEKVVSDPVAEGQKQFVQLGMTKTALRNGVLIYFAPKSQAFAIIGDEAIHRKCGQQFWEQITGAMTPLLKSGKYTEAIVAGVERVGTVLVKEFPVQGGDRNELSNAVVRENPEK